jgi:hypothetical protein
LVSLHQIDFDHFVRRKSLQIERNANAIGRQRTPE